MVLSRRGCVFQVLPEVAQASADHPARTDPHAYWPLRTSWPYSAVVASFIQSKQLQRLLQDCLGSQTLLLYNEQYIIKPPHSKRSSFSWHYDSKDCCMEQGVRYSPYLSLWLAIDDMTADNGCLVVQPNSHKTACCSCGCISSTTSASSVDEPRTQSHREHLQQAPAHAKPNAGYAASWCSHYQATREQPVQYIAVSNSWQLQDALSNSCGCCDAYGALARHAALSTNDPCVREPLGDRHGGQERPPSCRPLGLLLPAGTAVSSKFGKCCVNLYL